MLSTPNKHIASGSSEDEISEIRIQPGTKADRHGGDEASVGVAGAAETNLDNNNNNDRRRTLQ